MPLVYERSSNVSSYSAVYDCHYETKFFYYFFFQAEDGIRDLTVTGVQTCALPIFTDVIVAAPSASEDGAGSGLVAVFYGDGEDRKSTRLNSSHSQISYAVFCLKKKKKKKMNITYKYK